MEMHQFSKIVQKTLKAENSFITPLLNNTLFVK